MAQALSHLKYYQSKLSNCSRSNTSTGEIKDKKKIMKKSNAKLFTLLSKTTISSKQVVKVKQSDTEKQECNIAKCLERSCLPHWSILILSHNLKGKSTRSKWLHTQGWFLWPAFETTSINSAKSDRSVRQHHVDTNNRQYCARFTFLTLPLKCMVYDEAVNVTDVTVNSFSSDDLLMKSYEAFFFTIFILISQNKTRKKTEEITRYHMLHMTQSLKTRTRLHMFRRMHICLLCSVKTTNLNLRLSFLELSATFKMLI